MNVRATIASAKESWALKKPFRFAGHTILSSDVVTVRISRGGFTGRGEATGVIYRSETPDTICADIAAVKSDLECVATREALREMLPPGGARNALDCALWDLECKEAGKSIWQMLDLAPHPVLTVMTVGLDAIETVAAYAASLKNYPLLKVKLDGDDPLHRMRAIRAARPDARIVVDANQSWDMPMLRAVAEPLRELGIEMIEQPLAAGHDEELAAFRSPVPLCADESCFTATDVPTLRGRYQMVNIKLDKSGGLTEALAMVRAAKACGLALMVGNMIGTSRSMAPSHVIAQSCSVADLDGPLALVQDRADGLEYRDGEVAPPSPALWG